MMNKLTQMQGSELQDVNGGMGVFEVILGVAALYGLLREAVRDAGEAKAYEDLGY